MKVFADKLGSITKLPDGYIAPSDSWTGATIGSDIFNVSNKDIQRLKNYLRSGIWRWYFEYVQGHSY